MLAQRHPGRMLGLMMLLSVCGCMAWKGQWNTCQTQNRALSEKNAALQAEVENLRSHRDQLIRKLQQAEEEAALVRQENELIRRRLELKEQAGPPSELAYGASLIGPSAQSRLRLEQLAKRFPSLGLNPVSGQCQLVSERLFRPGQSQLRPEAESTLNGLVQLVESAEGKEFRVWIVAARGDQQNGQRSDQKGLGQAGSLAEEQALALKEKLCQMGLAAHRIGLASVPMTSLAVNSSDQTADAAASQLKVFLLPPEIPIVGWIGRQSQRF